MNEFETIRRALPESQAPDLRTVARARRELTALADGLAVPSRARGTAPSLWSGIRPRLAAGVAVAAVAAGALVLFPGDGPGGDSGQDAGSAQEILMAAAAASADTPATSGKWWKVGVLETPAGGKNGAGGAGRTVLETWLPGRGDTVWEGKRELDGAGEGSLDKAVTLVDGSGPDAIFGDLEELSADPAAFRRAVLAGQEGQGNNDRPDAWVFQSTARLLTQPLSPEVRSTAYQVLADVPGVENLGRDTDRLGREGVRLSNGGQQILIDPDTGDVLEETGGDDAETVRTVLDAEWTDEEPRVPSATLPS